MLKSIFSFNKTGLPLLQQNRSIKYRKHPTAPRPKGKRFYVIKKPDWNLEEQALLKKDWSIYKSQMRSIYQLFKTEHKFMGSESEVAQLELERNKKRLAESLLMNE
jgi:hypothetical protein